MSASGFDLALAHTHKSLVTIFTSGAGNANADGVVMGLKSLEGVELQVQAPKARNLCRCDL